MYDTDRPNIYRTNRPRVGDMIRAVQTPESGALLLQDNMYVVEANGDTLQVVQPGLSSVNRSPLKLGSTVYVCGYADGEPLRADEPDTTGWSDEKRQWVAWLEGYGAAGLFDSIMASCQGAESTCRYCGETITFDITEGGGVPDWGVDGDYGCPCSPDTDDEGTGGHLPVGADY
jgi:hypothetical protein